MTNLFIRQDLHRIGVYTARLHRAGQVVLRFEPASWRERRDRDTVQHPSGGHIFHALLARVLHSCEPNCRVSFFERALVALRDIEPGEAISFDYRTTEREIARPFSCHCGSASCAGRIA